jgi:hypothetical protein
MPSHISKVYLYNKVGYTFFTNYSKKFSSQRSKEGVEECMQKRWK